MLQLVTGGGATGAALCRAGVDKIAFTGSTATAKKIMAACAETLTPVLLECGGKDAMIVDADADVDAAADAALWGGMTNAGQTCIGIERVYVVDAVYDEFVAAAGRAGPVAAPGRGPDRVVGPITMPAQLDVIRRHMTTRWPAAAGRWSAAPTRCARRTRTRPCWSTCRRTPPRCRRRPSGRR